MAHYLVTGGGGFIGSNVVHTLLTQGHQVRVLENFLTGKRENLADVIQDIDLIEGDFRDMETVERAVKSIDYILHIGALPSVPRSVADPILSNNININGTLNVLESARHAGVQRVVFSSSSSVYGDTPTLPKQEDMPMNPLSPYASHKATGEMYCRVYHNIYKLETVCLRYFNVFGPHQDPHSQYAAVIPNFVKALESGRQPTIHGDGEQSRDFTFIDNVVKANISASIASKAAGQVMNIACGSRITINQLAQKIATLLGKELKPNYVETRTGDVKHSLADISRAQTYLEYSDLVDVDSGLQKTVAWFTQH